MNTVLVLLVALFIFGIIPGINTVFTLRKPQGYSLILSLLLKSKSGHSVNIPAYLLTPSSDFLIVFRKKKRRVRYRWM